jgi:arsenate reductase
MKNILFVCVGNSGRSQMAEAYFNHMAGDKARASSAGTEPARSVDPQVIALMKEEGIDISGNHPKKLTLEMLEQADKVITMGCGVEQACPASFVETQDWELNDPKGKTIDEVKKIRDEIKKRVTGLIRELDA